MKSMVDIPMLDLGLAGYNLNTGLLSPSAYHHDNPFVWILSTTTSPQPSNKIGKWYDASLWNDTNVWYD